MSAAFDLSFLSDAILIWTNAQTSKSISLDGLITATGFGTPSLPASVATGSAGASAAPDAALSAALQALVASGSISFDGTTIAMIHPDIWVLTPTGDAAMDTMLNELAAKIQAGSGIDTLQAFLAPLRTVGATAGALGNDALLMVNMAKLHALIHNGNTAAYAAVFRGATVDKAISEVI